MDKDNKKIALLIDAENTSVKYVDSIFTELRNYGTVTYKRMYGDFTSKTLSVWNKKANEYAIVPIQQPRYSNVKNAADIMLVIDAMDILYAKNVDCFCIVSSDSDFTRLVNRLKEAGLDVIGMGKSDASKTLKTACTIYKNLELIADDVPEDDAEAEDTGKEEKKKKKEGKSKKNGPENNITSLDEIRRTMIEIVREDESKGDKTSLGVLKNRLLRMYNDFDERNYGYSTMTRLVNELRDLEIYLHKNAPYVRSHSQLDENSVRDFVSMQVEAGPVELGRLGQKLHDEFPNFDIKTLGYSQLGKFIQNIDGVELVQSDDGKNRNMVQKA